MGDSAEAPTCRICRSEAEAGAPLFHPCKCTGSIGFCHQDWCVFADSLIEWLQHSQKKHCELCGYAFVFRKRYAQSMPGGRLSPLLYVRFAVWRIFAALMVVVRLVLAAIGWLVAVPHITYEAWHYLFYLADSAASIVLNAAPPKKPEIPFMSRAFFVRLYWPARDTWPYAVATTAMLATAFISVFLLREWIVQNMHHLLHAPEPDNAEERAQMRAAALDLAQARALRAFDEIQARAQEIANVPVAPPHEELHGDAPEALPAENEDAWETDESGDWMDEGAPPPPPPAFPPLPAELDADDDALDRADDGDWDNEEIEQLEEDWNGVLDALGLRGPLVLLLQNLFVLQVLCISVAAVAFVLPYFIGRVVGFKVHNLFLLPIDLLRTVTDPVFDAIFSTVTNAPVASSPEQPPAGDVLGTDAHGPVALKIIAAGHIVYRSGAWLQEFTQGRNVWERALCIVLGNAYVLLLVALEARFLIFGSLANGGVAARVLREQLLIIKVLFFSVLDLVVFPLGCGVILDWCLFPLLPGATPARRVGEALATPISFTFFRWMSGTMYMFHVAQFIGVLRTLLRPGVMHWMRDPNDLDFHPIRDILSQPTGIQLVKLGESALTYAFVLVTLVGANLRLMQWAFPSLFPLRWMPFAPLTGVPLDLMFVHLALRLVFKRTRFVKRATRILRRWLIVAAKLLRLSSFMLADEQLDEQGTFEFASLGERMRTLAAALSRRPIALPPPEPTRFTRNGGYARVPADDKPARNVATFIYTDASGVPVDHEARDALAKQLRAITRMSTHPRYTIVYVPPLFRTRVYGFVGAVWLFAAACISSLAVPLVCGRHALGRYGLVLHDMYAFAAGCAILLALAYTAAVLRPLFGHGLRYRVSTLLARVPQTAKFAARATYLLGVLGVLVPLLTGIVLHQCACVLTRYPCATAAPHQPSAHY